MVAVRMSGSRGSSGEKAGDKLSGERGSPKPNCEESVRSLEDSLSFFVLEADLAILVEEEPFDLVEGEGKDCDLDVLVFVAFAKYLSMTQVMWRRGEVLRCKGRLHIGLHGRS